jgi:hypothetical protein
MSEDQVDDASEDSFPASDPPSFSIPASQRGAKAPDSSREANRAGDAPAPGEHTEPGP